MNTQFDWSVVAFPKWSDEDRVWYPHVRWLLNGEFSSEKQYIIGFEDAATAATFARTLRTEEIERFNTIIRQVREDNEKRFGSLPGHVQ